MQACLYPEPFGPYIVGFLIHDPLPLSLLSEYVRQHSVTCSPELVDMHRFMSLRDHFISRGLRCGEVDFLVEEQWDKNIEYITTRAH